jgi:hypothetical protein
LNTELYQAVFTPLEPAIGGTKRLFLSPDGSLNLIPFEVLRSTEGRYLIEDYAFTYPAAERDLAGFGMVNDKGGRPSFLVTPILTWTQRIWSQRRKLDQEPLLAFAPGI